MALVFLGPGLEWWWLFSRAPAEFRADYQLVANSHPELLLHIPIHQSLCTLIQK